MQPERWIPNCRCAALGSFDRQNVDAELDEEELRDHIE